MSVYNTRANYHLVSAFSGSLPNGSYLLPGNGYYSNEGRLPRIEFPRQKFVTDPKYNYSQSYRIDAIDSLRRAKRATSLSKSYSYNPHLEATRERHLFVPKHFPNENPSSYEHKGLQHFKDQAYNPAAYTLRSVNTLPPVDYVTVSKEDKNDEIYRIHQPTMPYDMMVLRDEQLYKTQYSTDVMTRDKSFVSATTVVPRGC